MYVQRQIFKVTRYRLRVGDSRSIVRPNIALIGAKVFLLNAISVPASVISIDIRILENILSLGSSNVRLSGLFCEANHLAEILKSW